jgi:uncharacterized protein (DUF305 family)
VSPGDDAAAGRRAWPFGVAQTLVILLLCALLAGAIGWQLGDRESSESFNDADAGFLADMIVHHNGAVALGFDYLPREHDPVIAHFAREIVSTQSAEMAVMSLLLGDAGNPAIANDDIAMEWMDDPVDAAGMPGLASEAEFAELRAASGVTVDDVFTRLMIRHHAAGIAMARRAAESGENPRVRRLARTMAQVQGREIADMNRRRAVLGPSTVDVEAVLGASRSPAEGHADHGH